MNRFLLFTHLLVLLGTPDMILAGPVTADIVIHGGTSAGIVAAVQAKRMGKSVVVVAPEKHLGGLTAGGLGWTDSGNKAVIGGISREFYHRVWLAYQKPDAWKNQTRKDFTRPRTIDDPHETMWSFEPHVAERIFEDWVREECIPVFRNQRLDRDNGVTLETGGRISRITTLEGKTFAGKMFIDATYEGDLMAAAGVSHTVGREPNQQYGETLNGVQTGNARSHQFDKPVSACVVPGDPSSGLLPGVSSQAPGPDGSGDRKVQAYCFRTCMTNAPENRVPFPKPVGYDARQYELLARYLKTGWDGVTRKFDPVPNRKTDTNNHGGFSFDNIGMNYDYPEASYERRAEIIREHETYQKGLLWFLANDPQVPEKIRAEVSSWGLARDEFTDNGNWPHQLYVREARRMVADFVVSEGHLRLNKPTPRPVGMGSYNMDSHNVQRHADADGHARNEGDIQVRLKKPYPVDFHAIVPKRGECPNLLVPVCVSASHIAYGSIRMEPVFMILGQSASTAASIAIDASAAVQDIPYSLLRKRLLADGQVLEFQASGPVPTPE